MRGLLNEVNPLKKRKMAITILVLVAVAAGGWYGYKRFFAAPASADVVAEGPEGAPVVQVQPVVRQMLVQEVFAPGTVRAGNLQEYKAAVASPRVTLLVEVGQQVEEGQVLAELDATELLEEVKAKERDLLQAQRRLQELQRSVESAPLQLERQLEEARRQLIEAQNQLVKARAGGGTGESSEVAAVREKINQLRNQVTQAQQAVDQARAALAAAEAAYLANPGDAEAERNYRNAEAAYRQAVEKNQETARETASALAQAEAELESLLSGEGQDEDSEENRIRLLEIQVRLAEVAVKEAEEAVRRGPDMGQIEVAQAEVEAAQATLEKLRNNLDSTRIVATAPGTVLSLGVSNGDPVQAGMVIVRVGDMERMELVGQVEAVDLDSLEPGQTIMVTSALLPLASFEGVVTGVAQQTQQSQDPSYPGMYYGENVTFEVRGVVDNPEGRLKSGMSVEMRIETARKENVMVVPLLAVREEAGQAFVLVVKDYTVELRPIQTGLVTNMEVEVISGLEEGEMIITSPFGLIETLQDGDQVRIEVMPGMEGGMFPAGAGRRMPGRARAITVPVGLLAGGAQR